MRWLVASIVMSAACARVPDPCAKFDRDACLTLEVLADRSGVEIDQLRLRAPMLGISEALSPSKPLSPPSTLPVYIALVMPIGWSSNIFTLDVDGLLNGAVVGTKNEVVQIGGGEHRRISITLVTPAVPPDFASRDLAASDLASDDLARAPLDGGFTLPTSRDVDAGVFAQSTSGLNGGDIQWIDARGDRVLATTRAGLFRSDNAGTSWRKVGAGLPTDYLAMAVMAPTNPNIVYATAGFYAFEKLARSDDGGETFAPVGTTNFTNGPLIAVSHQNPDVLYVGNLRSIDGGKSFNSPTGHTGDFSYQPVVSPLDDTLAFWTNNDGMWRTTDGQSWSAANLGAPSASTAIATRLQFDAAGANVFAFFSTGAYKRSPSDGASWILAAQPPTDKFIWAGAVKPDDANVILYSTDVFSASAPGFFRKDSTGTSAAGVGLAPMGARSLAFDPTMTTRVWIGSGQGGAFRSDDGGQTLVQRTDGIRALMVNDIALDPGNARVMWAATADGLWQSFDGGASWLRRSDGLPARTVFLRVRVIAGSVWAASSSQLFKLFGSGFASQFSGSSLSDFDVEGANVYVALMGGGLMISRQGGANFAAPAQGPPANVERVAVDPVNPSIVWTLAGINAGFHTPHKSTDRGDHFTQMPGALACSSIALDPTVSGTVYAGCTIPMGSARLLKSENGGSSWTPAESGLGQTPRSLVVAPSNRNVLYAASFGQAVQLSTDGAQSWRTLSLQIDGKFLGGDPRVASLAVDPRNEAVLLVGLNEFPSLIRRAPTN